MAENRKGDIMEENRCILDPERDCLGLRRAEEVAGDVKALDRKLDELRQGASETNARFGGRIGRLEAREEVREEQYKHVREKLEGITRDMEVFQRENKDSVAELRREHKESMEELRKGNREILDAVTPLKHKVEGLAHLEEDVEELKKKPGKTWEHIKAQALAWAVAAVMAIIAGAMGISQFIK